MTEQRSKLIEAMRRESTDSELWAWAAGLFEGEGTISITSARVFGVFHEHAYAGLSMTQTDLDILEAFQHVVGTGSIYPVKRQRSHHKPAWRWSTGRLDDVQRVLRRMRPFLGSRRGAKADLALALVVGGHIKRTDRLCAGGHPLFGAESDVLVKANGWLECRFCRRSYDRRRYMKKRGRQAEAGSAVPMNRTVHAQLNEKLLVRYGVKGAWKIEFEPRLLRPTRLLSVEEAAREALKMETEGGSIYEGLPGGSTFQRWIRTLRSVAVKGES